MTALAAQFDAFKKSAAARLKAGDSLLGRDGVLTPLLKEFLEQTLEGELEAHLQEDEAPNRKNSKGQKRLKTSLGPIEMATPRDRNSTFEPELVAKRQRTLGVDLDRQIIALYARGASYSDIRDHLMDMYGLEASTATISRVAAGRKLLRACSNFRFFTQPGRDLRIPQDKPALLNNPHSAATKRCC